MLPQKEGAEEVEVVAAQLHYVLDNFQKDLQDLHQEDFHQEHRQDDFQKDHLQDPRQDLQDHRQDLQDHRQDLQDHLQDSHQDQY